MELDGETESGLSLLLNLSSKRGTGFFAAPIQNSALGKGTFANDLDQAGVTSSGDHGLGEEARVSHPAVMTGKDGLEFAGPVRTPIGLQPPDVSPAIGNIPYLAASPGSKASGSGLPVWPRFLT